jgi:hypothetical protein
METEQHVTYLKGLKIKEPTFSGYEFEILEFSSINAKQSEESSISQTPSTASIRYRILNILFF